MSDTTMRRKDRAIDDKQWIIDVLYRAPVGVFATVHDGRPFSVARNFAYDEKNHAIYMHGAKKGRTFSNVSEDGLVCINVSEVGRMFPDARAMNFGIEFNGVVIFGKTSLVTDNAEAKRGLQLLIDKHFSHLTPDVDYESTTDTDLKITAVYRVDISAWSGKQKITAEDHPGAFYEDKGHKRIIPYKRNK